MWVADYGAVRDFGQSSPEIKFVAQATVRSFRSRNRGHLRICPK